MSIKTNFLELEKLQGHENYNGDIENSNLDKIDVAFKSHDERTKAIEEKVHKKDQLSVELTPTNRVVSVTGSSGGGCGFEIEGTLVENLANKNTFQTAYITANNEWQWSENTTTVLIPVEEGRTYRGKTDGNRNILVFFDINPTNGTLFMIGSKTDGPQANPFNVVAPIGAKYLAYYIHNEEGKTAENVMILKDIDLPDHYFEGIQPTRGIAIESIGKNLFDGDVYKGTINLTTGETIHDVGLNYTATTHYIHVQGGVNYTISSHDLSSLYIFYYESNMSYVGYENSKLYNESKLPYGGYIRCVWTSSWNSNPKVMMEQGSVTTEYKPHQSSKVVFDDALAKLPNGKMDKIVRENGKTIKYANTNIGRDGEFTYIDGTKGSIAWNTGFTNINWIGIENALIGNISFLSTDGSSYCGGRVWEQPNGDYWNENNLDNIYSTHGNVVYFSFPKSVATEEEAIEIIKKIPIVYQLSEQQSFEITSKTEIINVYEDYTQFSICDGNVEDEKGKLVLLGGIYLLNDVRESNSLLNYKTKNIDRVIENSRNITLFGTRDNLNADGTGRWYISKVNAEVNGVNVKDIYVDYETLETNGQTNVKITYSADLSSTISSNSTTINVVGEQVDKNTKEISAITDRGRWIDATLLNGFTGKAKYRISGNDIVEIELDNISNGAIGQAIFIFPELIKPIKSKFLSFTNSENKASQLIISSTSGSCYLQTSGNTSELYRGLFSFDKNMR